MLYQHIPDGFGLSDIAWYATEYDPELPDVQFHQGYPEIESVPLFVWLHSETRSEACPCLISQQSRPRLIRNIY